MTEPLPKDPEKAIEQALTSIYGTEEEQADLLRELHAKRVADALAGTFELEGQTKEILERLSEKDKLLLGIINFNGIQQDFQKGRLSYGTEFLVRIFGIHEGQLLELAHEYSDFISVTEDKKGDWRFTLDVNRISIEEMKKNFGIRGILRLTNTTKLLELHGDLKEVGDDKTIEFIGKLREDCLRIMALCYEGILPLMYASIVSGRN